MSIFIEIHHQAREIVEMKKYEYKIEYVKLVIGKDNEDQVVDALNKFGEDGWRLNRMYGEMSLRSLSSWKGGFNLLLEREVQKSLSPISFPNHQSPTFT